MDADEIRRTADMLGGMDLKGITDFAETALSPDDAPKLMAEIEARVAQANGTSSDPSRPSKPV
jgi:hypothetical protein